MTASHGTFKVLSVETDSSNSSQYAFFALKTKDSKKLISIDFEGM